MGQHGYLVLVLHVVSVIYAQSPILVLSDMHVICALQLISFQIYLLLYHACVKNFDENAFTDPMLTHWMFHLRVAIHFGIALHRCDLESCRAKPTDLRTCLGSHLPVQMQALPDLFLMFSDG